MRSGSKGARDFFGRERALSVVSFAAGASSSAPLDLGDAITGGEQPSTPAPRIRRSRVESIRAGSKSALDFFGGPPHA
jgi:hypothetical protein